MTIDDACRRRLQFGCRREAEMAAPAAVAEGKSMKCMQRRHDGGQCMQCSMNHLIDEAAIELMKS